MVEKLGPFSPGSIASMRISKNAIAFQKAGNTSTFNSTTLDTKLRGLRVTTVVVCGAWTNWAIEHTCRDAADLGYEVVVVTDGTATISAEFQDAALNFALTTVAARASVDDVIAALQ